MKTHVVNIRSAEQFDVYIGRAGHGYDGYFGNPVRPGQRCPVCDAVHHKPGDTLACYGLYFNGRVVTDPTFRARILALRGKRLGCFCAPKPCHGDVIATWIDVTNITPETSP